MDFLREPALYLAGPAFDALDAAAVRAEHAEPVQCGQRAVGLASHGGLDHRSATLHGTGLDGAPFCAPGLTVISLPVDPFDVRVRPREDIDRRVRVAALNGAGQVCDRTTVTVDVAQDDDAVTDGRARRLRPRRRDVEAGVRSNAYPHRVGHADRIRGGADDAAQDSTRLDGCELFRVSDQHDAGSWRNRL